MKKTIFSLMIAAFSVLGLQAQNQETFVAPAISSENQTVAESVIEQQVSDPDAANNSFSKLLRNIRKDKEQLVAVGKFFLEKKIYPCAKQCAQQAYTLDPTYIPSLMLSGHVAMMRKDWGTAGQKFDEVLNYEPDNIDALRLNARVYKYVNPIVAKEMLTKIIQKEPENVGAYKELGDIAYHMEEYKDAVDAYKSFFEKNTKLTVNELRSGENYLISLMNQKDFATIKEMAPKFLEIDSTDLIVRRMLFFSQVDQMDFQGASNSIKYLTEKQYDDSLYLYLDYTFAASYAADALGDKAMAIDFYKQALKKDSTKVEGYKQLANLLRQNKQAAEAIPVYEKYISLLGEKADDADRFGLGNMYLAAKGQATTPEERQKFIDEGDKIFAAYSEAQPTRYQGPFYRAQLWITDPQKAEEKPREYYAKALELIGNDADLNAQKKLALQYLMIYALKTNDDATCKTYMNQVLAIDPADKLALQIQNVLK